MITKNFNTFYQAMNNDTIPFEQWQLVNTSGKDMVSNYFDSYGNSLTAKALPYFAERQATTNYLFTNDTTSGTVGFAFGTGNDAPTVDDYKLSGDVIPSSSYTYTQSSTLEYGDGYVDSKILFTITNASTEPITIGEIGLFSGGYLRPWTSGYYQHMFLLERTAFDIPITIEAGGIGQVTYTIRTYNPVA